VAWLMGWLKRWMTDGLGVPRKGLDSMMVDPPHPTTGSAQNGPPPGYDG
jgi:hypothetical protein